MSTLSRPLTRRCDLCRQIGQSHHALTNEERIELRVPNGVTTVCLPCFADRHACDVCGGRKQKRRLVTPADRERLPDLVKSVKFICENCLRVRLIAREREVIVTSREEQARLRGRRRR